MHKKIQYKLCLFGFFILGIIVGSIIANFFLIRSEELLSLVVMDIYCISNLKEISKNKLFVIIIFNRLKQLVAIISVFLFINSKLILSLLCILAGVLVSVFISIEAYALGLLGVVIFVFSLMPQFIFYLLSLFVVYRFSIRFKEKNFSEKKKDIMVFIPVTIILVLLGCLLEAYINPILLSEINKYIINL